MNLADFKLLPAVIDSTNDPEKLGRVKCTIPGVTDNSMICEDNMPWVMPLPMSGYQRFSMPMQGQKVWVLVDNDDNKNLWYIPLFEYIDITEDYLNETYGKSTEVLVSRNLGGQKAMSTYDDDNGFVTELRNSKIQIEQDGDVMIKSNDSNVRINGGVVFTGKGTENDNGYERAVKGETLRNLLNDLKGKFSTFKEACNSSPYTKHLSLPKGPLDGIIDTLSKAESILCNYTKVN